MKQKLYFSLFFLLVIGLNTRIYGQCAAISAVSDITLQCGSDGAFRVSMTFNPNQNLYYSVCGGTSNLPIETFSVTGGSPLFTSTQNPDYRGYWWNSSTNLPEGNAFNGGGIYSNTLNASFYAGGASLVASSSMPDPQSCGAGDIAHGLVIYYNAGTIYKYSRSTGAFVSSVNITGLPVSTGNLNSTAVIYTGITGAEAGVYDYINQKLYFINYTTGAYVSTCSLPASAPNVSSYCMGFGNGHFFLFDSGTARWIGYPVVNNTCGGSALEFDGSDDVVTLPDFSSAWNLGNNFSVEMWINPNSTNNAALLYSGLGCSECEAWSLTMGSPQSGCLGGGSSGHIVFSGGGVGAIQSDNVPTVGAWTHIAVTYNGAVLKMYINGALQTSTVATTGSIGGSQHRNIGGDPGCSGRFMYSGAIDELRMWNRALCPNEITNNMNCQVSNTAIGLTALYHFNQGIAGGNNSAVNTLTDASSSNVTGSLNNFSLSGYASNWVWPGGVFNNTLTCSALSVPDIKITGNSVTIIPGATVTSSGNNTSFGNVLTGSSLSQTFIIQNTGGAALTISSYNLSGSSSFSITTNPAASVASSGSTAIVIRFSPTATGLQQTTLSIVSNDCDESPYTFALGGTGVIPGAALNFDGVDDYVAINYTQPTTNVTNEFWFKTTNGNQGLFSVDNSANPGSVSAWDRNIFLSSGNLLAYVWLGGPYETISTSGTNYADGNWHHVAHVISSTQGQLLYVDGLLKATGTATSSSFNTNTSVILGYAAISYTTNQFFNGSMDEVRLWTVARTQCDIQSYMNCEIPANATGLAANYHFNQGFASFTNPTVTTLTDATGSYNGTLVNFTLSGSSSNWVSPGGVVSGFTTAVPPAVEIDIKGNGVSIVDGSASPSAGNNTDFGATCTSSLVSKTFTIQNTGTAALVVQSGSLTGTGAGAFTLSALPASVAASGSVTFAITFSAATSGSSNATLHIYSNDCDEADYDIAITASVGITPTIAASSGTICQGQTFTITPTGAFTYTYSGGSATVSPASSTVYTVTGKSSLGCIASNSATVSVTVNTLPTVAANTSTTQICRNASVTLTGSNANTYTWTSPSGTVANGVAFSPTATAAYTVVGTSTAGCTSTNVAAVTVTVNVLPIVAASGSTTQICQNGSVTLTGSNANTYTWTSSSGTVANGVAFSPGSTATYSLAGTSTAGCTSTNAAVVTVTVNNLPIVVANSSTTQICQNASLTLTGSNANTYTWTSPGGIVTDGVAFSPTATADYTVVGTSTAGCTSTNVAVVTVSVNLLPVVSASSGTDQVCAGQNVTLNGSGAATYLWTGGVIDGAAFSPTSTATYSVTGTSTAGCTSTNVAAVTVTVNALPVLTITASSSAICINNTVVLTASGANTVTWTAPAGTITDGIAFSPTATAEYSVSGTSTAGCNSAAPAVYTVTVNPLPVAAGSASSPSICINNTVSLNGSGASTYTWASPTGTLADATAFSPTATADYTVTSTSTAGCTSTNVAVVTISVVPLPVVSASSSTDQVCAGNSITLNGSGASTYTWLATSSTVTDGVAFMPLSTDSYSVSGTSTTGCTSTNVAVVTVTVNALPVITLTPSSSEICINATVALDATGADTYTLTSPTGTLSNGAAFSPTTTATYSVTGTSTAGCVSANTTVAAITVNPLPAVSAGSNTTVICLNNTVTLNGSGASTYTWSSPTGTLADGIAFSPTATVDYSVTGTSTAGCTSTNVAVITITVNALPSLTVVSSNTAICLNNTVSLNTSGANTYTWSAPAGTVTDGVAFSPTATGVYTVNATDLNSCESTATINLVVIPLPTVTANSSSIAICINGSVTLNGSGASTYTWTAPSGTVTDGIAFSPTTTATYSVTGTSTAGCVSSNTDVITVTVNPLPTVAVNTSTDQLCLGQSITLSGSGANTYTWTSPTGTVADGVAFSPTATASYSLAGTSTAGCTSTNAAAVTVTVNALPTLSIAATSTVICINGTVAITASGASTYTWDAPAGTVTNGSAFSPTATGAYTVTGTDLNGCQSTSMTSITVVPLPTVTANTSTTAICINSSITLNGSGANTYTWTSPTGTVADGVAFSPTTTVTYSVTGTSTAGCVSSNTDVITVTVNPLPTVAASSSTNQLCMGQSVTLTGSGASTYTWTSPTGTLADGVAFSPTATASYSLAGTSTTGCTSTNVAVVTVTVNALPTLTITGNALLCNGGISTLTVGGAGTYIWSNSATGNTIALNPSSTTSYTVTGTDSHGCENTLVETVTVSPLPIVTGSISNSVICINNSVTLTGSGANTYTWTSSTGTVPNGAAFTPTATTSYSLAGTSTAGCTSTNAVVVSLTVNPLPTLTITPSNSAICMNGTVSLTASGAVTYTWSSSIGTITNGVAFSPTTTVAYSVTATDANSCQNSATTSIVVNPLPTVTANTSTTAICFNDLVTLSGGGANTYTWAAPAGTVTDGIPFSPTATASYTVAGTSTAGCTSTNTAVVSVTVNPLPVVNGSISNSSICVNNTVSLSSSGAFTYTWTSPTGTVPNGSAFSPTATTSYSLAGTSTAGCLSTNSAVVSLTVNPLPTITIVPSSTAVCMNGTVTLTASGASTYTWSGGAWNGPISNGAAFSPTLTSNYSVVATGSNSCQNSATTSVIVSALPTVTAAASSSAVCINSSITLNGSGANSYTWTSATGTVPNGVAFSPASTASYSLAGTDLAGCTSSNAAVVIVTVNPLPVVTGSASSTSVCLNNSVTLTGGGANTYTWTSPTGTVTDGSAFSPPTTASYSLAGIDLAGCTSTNAVMVTVVVNPLPNVTANGSSTMICLGNTLTLSGGGASTYSWTAASGSISDGIAFSPSATAVYTVAGTDSHSCSATNTISILVAPLPTVTATASSSVLCLGGNVTLSGNGASTYTWTTAAGSVSDQVAFSPAATASYSVVGTSSAGCLSTNTAVVIITVNALPAVTASVSAPVICNGGTTSVMGNGASSYTWSGGISDGAVFSPTQTTSYTVTGTNTNNCTNTTVATITVNPLPNLVISGTKTLSCIGETTTLTASGASTYTWDGTPVAATSLVITPSVSGTYSVTGTDANGCSSSASWTQSVTACNITLSAVAAVTDISCGAKHDGRIAINTVAPASNYSLSYYWSPATLCPGNDCGVLDSLAEGTYSVLVKMTYTSNGNFVQTDSVMVTNIAVQNLNGPCNTNVFKGITPNGDQKNDVLYIENITEYQNNKVMVFNRWGNKVFECTGYNNTDKAWPLGTDADKATSATYYYLIDLGDGSKVIRGWAEVIKD